MGPGGDVTVEVSFEQGRPALRVTAASNEKAYAILHELASTMVEIERAVRLRGLGEVRQGIGAGKVQPSQESTRPELATAGLASGELRWLLGLVPPPPVFAHGEDR
jgi:hypothetical protein